MNEVSRRGFLKTGAVAAVAATMGVLRVDAQAAGVSWPIGCFNRPWMQKFGSHTQPLSTLQTANWGFDAALKGIAEAGFVMVGLLTPMPDEPFLAADASGEYLAGLKNRIAASGLTATMGSLRINFSSSLDGAIQQVRRQIDHAQFLNLEWLLTFGVDNKEDYAHYCRAMADAADYAQERKIKLVLKPHGGSSGASEEIIRCLNDVGRPNFKIWYDAGNIVYYTGKDPVEELKPIAQYVTGFCAKDCAAPKSDVMIQFGTGKVDFTAVYGELKKAGFNGPTFIECAGGKTFQEVTDDARANRVFLERIFASL
ncbi:MAG TPA: sugar phosphate isomerase/epimerase [Candidatus Baltobacteraceae bacterium]|jgi:sugar phosphate isomerase/epimerase|nr:sugar phosphate isomerase/epimerase [Candidatus Baltobacteraceae bacterium]